MDRKRKLLRKDVEELRKKALDLGKQNDNTGWPGAMVQSINQMDAEQLASFIVRNSPGE